MTIKEQRRAQVLTRVLEGVITLEEAALVMGVSVRQARRLKENLRGAGPSGLVHGNRGRPSKQRTERAKEEAVVGHYRGGYAGTNVQHFTELLEEREGIALSVETVRRILKAAGLVAPHTRRVPKHRSRRERMAAEGMLLQIDASPFRWLGSDGPKWSLVGAIDDATSDAVAAVFRDEEDAAGYMLLLRQVVQTRGIPAAVYRDRHLIFEVPHRVHSVLEEDLAGQRFPTQVGRVLAELGIESIPASSPQAKGRVERSWRTQQDRLVTELRLAGVQTLDQANAFLPSYLVRYRARFTIQPRSDESAYVPIDAQTDLDRIFCFKYQRRAGNDNTIQFASQVIQIPPGPDRLSYARVVVDVHEHLDGSIAVYHHGAQLVLLPPPTEQSPLRSRRNPHRAYAETGASKPEADSPLSWDETLKRARAAREGPPLTEHGRPTSHHPWRRAMQAAARTKGPTRSEGSS